MPKAEKVRPTVCPNCDAALPPAGKVKYCPACGEKTADKRITLAELLGQFWNHFTHLNEKFLRTLADLLIPGRMTVRFFEGRSKRYPKPSQLFFISMFFFLLTVNSQYTGGGLKIRFNTGSRAAGEDPKRMIDDLREYAVMRRMRRMADSLPPALQGPEAREALDSLIVRSSSATLRAMTGGTTELDSIRLEMLDQSYRIDPLDLAFMNPDSLLGHYQIEGFASRLMIRQSIKSLREPDKLIRAYIGSASYTLLATVGMMAAVLGLMYWRRDRYYVEHLVLLLHWHAASLLVITLLIWLSRLLPGPSTLMIGVCWVLGSLWWAMHRMYRQGIGKTTLKWSLFLGTYLFAAVLNFVISLLVVIVLF
ncbi:MAG: DUF3667 domain-containing protein [Bacteroidia bacterium]|nr:DUF3667 domain-containing protein [Bacteroidia bacterium]